MQTDTRTATMALLDRVVELLAQIEKEGPTNATIQSNTHMMDAGGMVYGSGATALITHSNGHKRKVFGRRKCAECGRLISTCGFGSAKHRKWHEKMARIAARSTKRGTTIVRGDSLRASARR